MRSLTIAPVVRRLRRSPIAVETLLVYMRMRRRMARELDVRQLLSEARRARINRRRTVSLTEARSVGRVVSRTLSLLPEDPRCLVRSLVLIELLARRGVASTLVIGACTIPSFGAHAWVELGGEALLPAGEFAVGRLAEL
jgi:hypothetical protein